MDGICAPYRGKLELLADGVVGHPGIFVGEGRDRSPHGFGERRTTKMGATYQLCRTARALYPLMLQFG
jgi:hypothetical protein